MKIYFATIQKCLLKATLSLFVLNICINATLVVASDNVLSSIAQITDLKNIEQCVADVNQLPDDSLDTASRIYQTSLCYFCIGCSLEVGNGRMFEENQTSSINLDDVYATSYKLMQQAAELGSVQANYGLAVLIYAMDLSNNKRTKQQIAYAHTVNSDKNLDKANNEIDSTDALKQDISKISEDLEFNSEIHIRLLNAARKGHIPAQFALSEVYSQGIGVHRNKVQAYAWAATAVAQNPPFGSYRREQHAINMDYFELNEAESLAERFMKEYTDIFERSSITVMR